MSRLQRVIWGLLTVLTCATLAWVLLAPLAPDIVLGLVLTVATFIAGGVVGYRNRHF